MGLPLKKHCLGQRRCMTELNCETSTLGPVHLSGVGFVGSPAAQLQGQCMQEQQRSLVQGNPYLFRHEAPSYPPAA